MFVAPRTVVFVEDDDDLRVATVQSLELAGLEVQAFGSAAKALSAITPDFPGIVITDIRMPQMDGRRLFASVHKIDPEIPVILITGHADVAQAVEAMHEGAYDFVAKPFTTERLIRPAVNALEKRRLVMDNRKLRVIADEAQLGWPLIGQSPAMEQLRKLLREVARADVDTLIEGETGTGKELAARALHAWGPRHLQPFVVVNCAALPAGSVESELFGHELGAFQGAVRKRVGRLEHADRGTLFLDEVNAMPPETQAKLLRFLEEREVTPLGTNEVRTVNVRVIAALRTEPGAAGALRPDLYHRLNVVKVHVPTLRQRHADIPLLFAHFITRAAERFAREPPPMTDSVRRTLTEHDWPGNIRELAHFAERVLLDVEGETAPGPAIRRGLRDRVEQYEEDLIREALASHGGDIKATVAALCVPRKTFYDKVQRYQIDTNEYRHKRS
jgi:two-component system C4-dicarboxylate transport response regulator DctD